MTDDPTDRLTLLDPYNPLSGGLMCCAGSRLERCANMAAYFCPRCKRTFRHADLLARFRPKKPPFYA